MRIYFLVVVSLILASCDSSDEEPGDMTIASVELLPNDEFIIALDQVVLLEIVSKNADGAMVASGEVTWESSDTTVLAVTTEGIMTGENPGSAAITASAGGQSETMAFRVVDLTGTWIGGEAPDTVSYNITQSDLSVEGIFQSHLGFPPITDVNTGMLSGSLQFDNYFHTLELTTEMDCQLRIAGTHRVNEEPDGELTLVPHSTGAMSSSNCSIMGTIDFTTLRRE
ncbi:MAG: hypothetical protein HKN16_09385 [Saprospiraceae bacterium]|nr:hypothetical protein [Saprospiraceae bacterium]